MTFIVLGVDPGMKRTGAVIMSEEKEVIAAATFASSGPKFTKFSHGERVLDLSSEVYQWFENSCGYYGYDTIKLAVETPIMNKVRNVKGFSLQWRTVQAIISRFRREYDADIIEVHNTAVKIAATGRGNADKDEIIFNSPFAEGQFGDTVTGHDSVEALGDAWAIALCAFDPPSKHIRYTHFGGMACTEGTVHEH